MIKQSNRSVIQLLIFALGVSGLLLLILPQSVAAQSHNAKFKDIIVDWKSEAIPKVSVLVKSEGKKWALESDENGEFDLELPSENTNSQLPSHTSKSLSS